MAMVPEAVAFAFVCGVSPLIGLWSAVIMGFFTSAFGGRPGMISGASGACAVVMAELVQQHSVAYLAPAVAVAGVLQILAGVFKLGKFIRLVPHPVMLGFVNGLAIMVGKAQLRHFRSAGAWLTGMNLGSMVGYTGLTMGLITLVPRLTTAVPASLVSIVLVTVLSKILPLPLRTLADMAGAETFKGGLAVLPDLTQLAVPASLGTLQVILPFAIVHGLVGLIESLLTLTLIDGITETRGSTRRECVGQGLGNLVSGLFSGMGGCALIGQSLINVNSGGRGRLSGIAMSLALAVGILFAAPALGQVPVASVAGLMFMVCIKTFEWSSFRIFSRVPKVDAAVMVIVSAITVWKDLAAAVGAGVVLSALNFAWKSSQQIMAEKSTTMLGWKVYKLRGPLFFGSTLTFQDIFTVSADPDDVVIDFMHSRVWDHSALEAIDSVAEKYTAAGKKLHLQHLSPDCATLLEKAKDMVEVNILEDPIYGVADNYDKPEEMPVPIVEPPAVAPPSSGGRTYWP